MSTSKDSILHQLDGHYQQVSSLILCKQNKDTGLLPASTASNKHGDYTDAWVRDNVYSILAVWALALAYRKVPTGDRAFELESSAIRCMRGLLHAMMKQSHKVEKFKYSHATKDALHAKYNTSNGNTVVGDDQWGHLQVDATSLFLLTLSQMTASGLRIVCTAHEVNFIQNLVYYIEQAYRTPDYGIWERGDKINNGLPEINSSSVGMAIAAMESVHNLDLYHSRNKTTGSKVICMSDEISACQLHLEHTLPQESNSKEVDSALLSVIGFPAFSCPTEHLRDLTMKTINEQLEGKYGCKRFLLDGHQCVTEDHSRLHYEFWELQKFAKIECEWPLFFSYLYLDALFREDRESAETYRKKIFDNCVVWRDNRPLLPEVFFVEHHNIEAEKRNPQSQHRKANDNLPLIWAQSLFLIGEMINSGILELDDIDPLQRRLTSGRQRAKEIGVIVVAENDAVKQRLMKTQGEDFVVTTPNDAANANLFFRPHQDLVHVFQGLGECSDMKLSGRPPRPIGPQGTANVYRFPDSGSNVGSSCLFLPSTLMWSTKQFYTRYDPKLYARNLRRMLSSLTECWTGGEASPCVALYVTREMLSNSELMKILTTFDRARSSATIPLQRLGSVSTTLGAAQQLPPPPQKKDRRASSTTVPDLPVVPVRLLSVDQVKNQGGGVNMGYLSQRFQFPHEPIRDTPITQEHTHHDQDESTQKECLRKDLNKKIEEVIALSSQCKSIDDLVPKGKLGTNGDTTIASVLHSYLPQIAAIEDWKKLREVGTILRMQNEDLPNAVSTLIVGGTALCMRNINDKSVPILEWDRMTGEMTQLSYIIDSILTQTSSSWTECLLLQEFLIYLSRISQSTDLLRKISKLELSLFLRLIDKELAQQTESQTKARIRRQHSLRSVPSSHWEASELFATAPVKFCDKIQEVLSWALSVDHLVEYAEDNTNETMRSDNLKFSLEWGRIREVFGVLNLTPESFFQEVWNLVAKKKVVPIIGSTWKVSWDCAVSSTPNERNFRRAVENFLSGVRKPEFRHMIIEFLVFLAREGKTHHDVAEIDVDKAVVQAQQAFSHLLDKKAAFESGVGDSPRIKFSDEWEAFYALKPSQTLSFMKGAVDRRFI